MGILMADRERMAHGGKMGTAGRWRMRTVGRWRTVRKTGLWGGVSI